MGLADGLSKEISMLGRTRLAGKTYGAAAIRKLAKYPYCRRTNHTITDSLTGRVILQMHVQRLFNEGLVEINSDGYVQATDLGREKSKVRLSPDTVKRALWVVKENTFTMLQGAHVCNLQREVLGPRVETMQQLVADGFLAIEDDEWVLTRKGLDIIEPPLMMPKVLRSITEDEWQLIKSLRSGKLPRFD